ncbi:hypothetical protein Tco_1529558 [Tanacetum coccineum]
MDKEPLVDLEKLMDTPMAKKERLKKDDMDPKAFNKLRTRTTRKLSTRNTPTLEEHLIRVPPIEPMLLFTGGWLDSSILEWFAMSLRKWTAKKGHPKCKYMAPRLIEERRCRKESTKLKNYLMDAIDHNDDKYSPSVSQGTTFKAVVQPDLTYLPEISQKTECF